jgi:hypothetical protein
MGLAEPSIYLKKESGMLVMEEQSRHSRDEIKAPVADWNSVAK